MAIKFPLTCITNNQRYGFCYRLQERIRLRYNEEGQKVKNKKMTREEFDNWISEIWDIWDNKVTEELLAYRTVIKNDNPMGIDIEKVIQ